MPRINNLKLWLKRRLSEFPRTATFRVISREYYERRWWSEAFEVIVAVENADGGILYSVMMDEDKYGEMTFHTIEEVVSFIESVYPPRSYVYYYTRMRDLERGYETFDHLRRLLGVTWDEYWALSVLLARAMGYLNGRELRGLQWVKGTTKKCHLCWRNPAAVKAVFEYRDRRFSVYYCEDCWRETVNRAIDNIIKDLEVYREELTRYVEGGRGVS